MCSIHVQHHQQLIYAHRSLYLGASFSSLYTLLNVCINTLAPHHTLTSAERFCTDRRRRRRRHLLNRERVFNFVICI